MGGEISLTSGVGQGSTFNFRLMLFKLHKDPKEPEYNQSDVVGYTGRKQVLLVVDDDPNQRALMSDLLIPLGFDLLLAENAEQGFVHLQTRNVDLILLDVRMPDINGWQMVKMIRDDHYTLPVLMVSANARDAEYNLQAEGYHNGYIAKPVNLNALLGKIAQLLDLQWRYQESEVDPLLQKESLIKNSMPSVPSEQYQALISLAEIGYLSGFKDKFAEIESNYNFPEDSAAQIIEYVDVCNFPKIIEYLRELSNEA
ncbi:response regulator [Psychromonas sp. MME1]